MASSLNASTSGGGGVIVTSDATGNLDIQSGGSTVVAVTSAGVAVTGTGKFATTIGVGNATPSASGSGITFPATQSASSDANTLDDYEEGDWTPSVGGTATYAVNTKARYTKVGRTVYIEGVMELATLGTGSTINISGLPFTVNASVNGGVVISYWSGISLSAVYLAGTVGGTSIGIRYATAAATALSFTGVFDNTSRVDFSGSYTV